MIQTIRIRNFKSIADIELSLANTNVFIGANGSGKSNLLEAIGMVAAVRSHRIDLKDMILKGVRIAKPDLMLSSFLGSRNTNEIKIDVNTSSNGGLNYHIKNSSLSDIYSTWGCTDSSILPAESTEGASERAKTIRDYVSQYLIYSPSIQALRGFESDSVQYPLGINGEGLDVLLNNSSKEEVAQIKEIISDCVPWMDDLFFDNEDIYKMQGYKLGRSKSNLYFKDKFMQRKNNLFSAENVNEGALELLFHLTLFISQKVPDFFAIDNIENGLNPRLCRFLMNKITELSTKNNKQVLITSHNPAVLDGLNLNDENQRLYVVSRNDEGKTILKRIRLKPQVDSSKMKLSEMWMNGLIGGIPDNF